MTALALAADFPSGTIVTVVESGNCPRFRRSFTSSVMSKVSSFSAEPRTLPT